MGSGKGRNKRVKNIVVNSNIINITDHIDNNPDAFRVLLSIFDARPYGVDADNEITTNKYTFRSNPIRFKIDFENWRKYIKQEVRGKSIGEYYLGKDSDYDYEDVKYITREVLKDMIDMKFIKISANVNFVLDNRDACKYLGIRDSSNIHTILNDFFYNELLKRINDRQFELSTRKIKNPGNEEYSVYMDFTERITDKSDEKLRITGQRLGDYEYINDELGRKRYPKYENMKKDYFSGIIEEIINN